LNSFTIAAISILNIYFFSGLRKNSWWRKPANVMSVVLLIGVIGNIYTSFLNSLTGEHYAIKKQTYKATQAAIQQAQAKKIPILIMPDIAFPHAHTPNLPYHTPLEGDWVLKAFPAYEAAVRVPVYPITDSTDVKAYIARFPADITEVIVGNGQSYTIVKRY
jgi:hypothetical protein